jgi:CRP-like cAMP-binding protein
MLIEQLQRLSIAASDQDIAQELSEAALLLKYSPGEVIVREGDTDRDLYILVKGAVSVQIANVHTLVRNSVTHLGEFAMMDDVAPRSATLRAIDHVVCAKISEREFGVIADRHPHIWTVLATEAIARACEI